VTHATKDLRFQPKAIRSPRGTRITYIEWADGHTSPYPHAVLRGFCPCASCQGHSGEVQFLETTDVQQELEDIEQVGNYALALKWFDGHSSGIYSYKHLRSLCQCDVCLGR
jgi:DUF971 family protein